MHLSVHKKARTCAGFFMRGGWSNKLFLYGVLVHVKSSIGEVLKCSAVIEGEPSQGLILRCF